MIEKIVFKKVIKSYKIASTLLPMKLGMPATFLVEELCYDPSDWKTFFSGKTNHETIRTNNHFFYRYIDPKSQRLIINISHSYDEHNDFDYSADFLLNIIDIWTIFEQKHDYPFLELLINWEQETFEFKPLEHWIDPHKEEIEARAQSVINKFLARVEEWKKQNPDD